MLKAAEVHVGRAYGDQTVVGDHQLGVQEALPIEIDLHACLQHIQHIGHRPQMGEQAVGTFGQHDADVHPRQGCRLQSGQDRLGGHEIGSLNVEVAACSRNGKHQSLHDGTPLAHRLRRDRLHQSGPCPFNRRIIFGCRQQGAVHEEPVHQEVALQSVDCRTGHLQVRVPPYAKADALQVTLGNVHAANEPHPAVDDSHLPVVAVVHLAGE